MNLATAALVAATLSTSPPADCPAEGSQDPSCTQRAPAPADASAARVPDADEVAARRAGVQLVDVYELMYPRDTGGAYCDLTIGILDDEERYRVEPVDPRHMRHSTGWLIEQERRRPW